VRRKPFLAAWVVTTSEEKQLVGYRLADSEGERKWEAFLNRLHRCGMEGQVLKMVITDGNLGLRNALATVYSLRSVTLV
jgi:transposase-like protein